jgi:hypothetical protein
LAEGAAPVVDLSPGVDVLARLPAAGAEGAVIVGEHHEASVGEGARVAVEAVSLRGAESVRHRDRRARRAGVGGQV